MFYMDKSTEFSLQSVQSENPMVTWHSLWHSWAQGRRAKNCSLACEPPVKPRCHGAEGLHSCTAQQGDSDLRDGMIPHVVERHGLTLTHVEWFECWGFLRVQGLQWSAMIPKYHDKYHEPSIIIDHWSPFSWYNPTNQLGCSKLLRSAPRNFTKILRPLLSLA